MRFAIAGVSIVLGLGAGSACGAAGPRGGTVAAAPAIGRYPVPADVGVLVADAAAFARFSAPVRVDLDAVIAAPGPGSAAEVKEARFVRSILAALDDRWADAVADLDAIAAVETDPRAKAMTGLSIRVWADAVAHGGDAAAFGEALERAVAAAPRELVRPDLEMLRAMGQTFSPAVCRQLVVDQVGPAVQGGTIGPAEVHAVVFQRYAAVRLAPVGAVIDAVLGAHGVDLPPP